MSYVIHRRTLTLAALLLCALAAHAGAPAAQPNDLGQSWPRAQNLSIATGWNVYVFTRGNVRYLQINDASGNVHAAFAVSGNLALALPMGSDAQRVSTPQQPLAAVASANGQVVYSDLQLQVVAVPQANGFAWNVVSTAPASANDATVAQPLVCTKRECSQGFQ